ncbi:MAG: hypothetical protein O7G85_02735 [Planctomycetota bacterium]|nr:hypothetical protein [Planctomycetota bacterium]
MDDAVGRNSLGSCPHVNRNDHRCSSRFCLGRIEQAFSVCFGTYQVCPMYHQITQELTEAQAVASKPAATLPVVSITSHGQNVPLRATGT